MRIIVATEQVEITRKAMLAIETVAEKKEVALLSILILNIISRIISTVK